MSTSHQGGADEKTQVLRPVAQEDLQPRDKESADLQGGRRANTGNRKK